MIDWLLSVPRKVFQQYSGREQVQSYLKDYRHERRDELTGSSTFACHWKRYRELAWNENFRLLSWLQCAYSLSKSTKEVYYVPLVVNNYRSFPQSWLITGFVTRLTRRVSLVEQELLTLPDDLNSPRFLVGFVLLDLLFYVYVL